MSGYWSKVKWLVNAYKDARKSGFPLAKYGTQLTLGGIATGCVAGLSIAFTESVPLVSSIKFTFNDLSLVATGLSVLVVLVGLWLIYVSVGVLKDKQPKIARVMVLGLSNVELNSFPDSLLSKPELYVARVPVFLNQKENEGDIRQQIERLNAEEKVDLLAKFVLHGGCSQLYFGGLARVPFLVAYGALLRQCSAQVIYFDKSHADEQRGFFLLNDEDAGIDLLIDGEVVPNQKGAVGIAVGLSRDILPAQLPADIREHTLMATANQPLQRNLIRNQQNLSRISQAIGHKIDEISALPEVKSVHLFLSVQSTLAIDIGRRFQEGTHKRWVIHNFDGNQSQYVWALTLDQQGVSLYKA